MNDKSAHADWPISLLRVITDGEVLMWHEDENGGLVFALNVNDTFYWGTADCEPVTPDDFPDLASARDDVKSLTGVLGYDEWTANLSQHVADLYAARRRGERPQGASYKFYPEAIWPLFDACGPERETGLGNPRPHPRRSTSALDLLTPSDDDRHVPEPPAADPGKVRGAGPLNPGRLR